MTNEVGYQHIQGSKPQTLGYALNDSPVGLAAWITEKFHKWTHHTGNHEDAISKDEILTDVSIYWFTQSITSSVRMYYESRRYEGKAVSRNASTYPPRLRIFPANCSCRRARGWRNSSTSCTGRIRSAVVTSRRSKRRTCS